MLHNRLLMMFNWLSRVCSALHDLRVLHLMVIGSQGRVMADPIWVVYEIGWRCRLASPAHITAIVPYSTGLCSHSITDTIATDDRFGGLAGAAWGVLVVRDLSWLTKYTSTRAFLDVFHWWSQLLMLKWWLPHILHWGKLLVERMLNTHLLTAKLSVLFSSHSLDPYIALNFAFHSHLAGLWLSANSHISHSCLRESILELSTRWQLFNSWLPLTVIV